MTDGKKPETPITDAAKQWIDLEGEQVCLVDFLVAERLEASLIAAQKELEKVTAEKEIKSASAFYWSVKAEKAEQALALRGEPVAPTGDTHVDFERWLRTECFQAPPEHSYQLAKAAWKKAIALYAAPISGDPVAITAEQENAAMDVARQEYGHGVTRASIWAIYKAIVNAPLYAAVSGERVREAIPKGMALVPKILPLDIALDFMADKERADYEKPGNTSVASMVRIIATWEKLLALPLAAIQGEQE